MKKTIKKFMAALLAVALLCAMAVPAFAAEGASGTSAGNGSITINNAVDNMHYNFYRILDIATHTGTEPYTGVVYKTNPTWKGFIEQSTWGNYLTVNTDGTVTVKAAAENSSDFAASFAAAASTYATTNHISADYADQLPVNHQVHLTGVTLGYYLVSSTGWDSNQTIICSQCVLYIIPNEGQASAHSIGNNVVVGIAVCNCNSGLELHVLTNVGIIFAAQSVGGVLFDLFGD